MLYNKKIKNVYNNITMSHAQENIEVLLALFVYFTLKNPPVDVVIGSFRSIYPKF